MVSCTCCFGIPEPLSKGPGRTQPGFPWTICTCCCGRFTGDSDGSFWFRYGKYPDVHDSPAVELTPEGALRAWPAGPASWSIELHAGEAEEVLDEASSRGGFGALMASNVLEA